MSDVCYDFQGTTAQSARPGLDLGARVSAALDNLFLYGHRLRSRRRLLKLNDHMLKDIGLSRADAMRESDKPFWKA